MSYAIILNPYKIIKLHHQKQGVSDDLYNALLMRSIEIGANDLVENDEAEIKLNESIPTRPTVLNPPVAVPPSMKTGFRFKKINPKK